MPWCSKTIAVQVGFVITGSSRAMSPRWPSKSASFIGSAGASATLTPSALNSASRWRCLSSSVALSIRSLHVTPRRNASLTNCSSNGSTAYGGRENSLYSDFTSGSTRLPCGAAVVKQTGRSKEWAGKVLRESLKIRHFRVCPFPAKAELRRSWVAGVARDRKCKKNSSKESLWMYNWCWPGLQSGTPCSKPMRNSTNILLLGAILTNACFGQRVLHEATRDAQCQAAATVSKHVFSCSLFEAQLKN